MYAEQKAGIPGSDVASGGVGPCIVLEYFGAQLPIGLKGRLSESIFRRLARRHTDGELHTNLGIMPGLRWRIPAKQTGYAFGVPENDAAERATLALVKCLIKTSDSFFDVGANYGIFSVAVAASLKSRTFKIVAIEADPELAIRLQDNVYKNGLQIDVINAAVSDVCGRATFFRNHSDDSSGSLTTHFSSKHRTTQIDVETITLTEILERSDVKRALIKVDVEGAGALVWNGLASGVDVAEWLIMEIIGPESEAKLPEIIVRETGWHSYYIEDFVLREVRFSEYNYRPPFWNWLFCKANAEEVRALLHPPFKVAALA